MAGSVNDLNAKDIKVYASPDMKDKGGNEDAKVSYNEASDLISQNSIFQNAGTQQTSIISAKINETAFQNHNVKLSDKQNAVNKYLNGVDLATKLQQTIQSEFAAIGYEVVTVKSNESADGYDGEPGGAKDASGTVISANTDGIRDKLDAEVKGKINEQISALSKKAEEAFTARLETAVKQAQRELDASGDSTKGDMKTEQDNQILHTYSSAGANDKGESGSAGYRSTLNRLLNQGGKVTTANVDGQEVNIVTYKKDGEKVRVIIDDEGNEHVISKTKSSGEYLTDEGLASINASVQSDPRNTTSTTTPPTLKASDIRVRYRNVTDTDDGSTSRQAVMRYKVGGETHRTALDNRTQDNYVGANDAIITSNKVFQQKTFMAGNNSDRILHQDGVTVQKSHGQRVIINNNAPGDFNRIGVTDYNKMQQYNNALAIREFQSHPNVQGKNYKIELSEDETKPIQITPPGGQAQTYTVAEARAYLDGIQDDNNSLSRHDATNDITADKVDIKIDIPGSGNNKFNDVNVGGDTVHISPHAKNVHFKRSEWNHSWSKDTSMLNNITQNARSVEDVFNILADKYNIKNATMTTSIRNLLIQNNPSIFDQDGHVYDGASFKQRLDLPTEAVLKKLLEEGDPSKKA